MKPTVRNLGLLTALLAPFAVAFAQPPGGPIGTSPHEAMDRDDDDQVTREEMYGYRAQRQQERAAQGYPTRNAGLAPPFEQIDANGDGLISREEMDRFHASRWQQRPQWAQQPAIGSPVPGPGYGRGYGRGPGPGPCWTGVVPPPAATD